MSASSLYVFIASVLLWHAWRGWRLGPIRLAISIGAIAAAWAGGRFYGEPAAELLRPFLTGYPSAVILLAGRAATALGTWLLVVILGAVLFKRTEHQSVGVVRFFYGLIGMIAGLAYGAVLLWLFFIMVRLVGAAAPALTGNAGSESPLGRTTAMFVEGARVWREELERGVLAPVVAITDPLSPAAYARADRIGRVLSQPAAMRRFFESPAARELVNDPRLRATLEDPEVSRLVTARDFQSLLRHPRVAALIDDPATQAKWRSFDLDAGLAYALEETAAAKPTPP